METIKKVITEDLFNVLNDIAQKEVSKSLKTQLVDKYRQEKYYHHDIYKEEMSSINHSFYELKLLFTPQEITLILFKAKLLFACKSKKEFSQRSGGGSPFRIDFLTFDWEKESLANIDLVAEKHFNLLQESIKKRRLDVIISNFNDSSLDKKYLYENFPKFIQSINSKFDLIKSVDEDAYIFGYETEGTEQYIFYEAVAIQRTFLNLLRISIYLNPGQMDVGFNGAELTPPITPTFRNSNSHGGFNWDEDDKKPYKKNPDGSLAMSFNSKSITKSYLDERNFGYFPIFFKENKIIFDNLQQPFQDFNLNFIIPIIDILNSVTQMSDNGAKILQIYCTLEHLFVPEGVSRNNSTYIKSGIYALDEGKKEWFQELYKIRNQYAHKAYVDLENPINFIRESLINVIHLVKLKTELNKIIN